MSFLELLRYQKTGDLVQISLHTKTSVIYRGATTIEALNYLVTLRNFPKRVIEKRSRRDIANSEKQLVLCEVHLQKQSISYEGLRSIIERGEKIYTWFVLIQRKNTTNYLERHCRYAYRRRRKIPFAYIWVIKDVYEEAMTIGQCSDFRRGFMWVPH